LINVATLLFVGTYTILTLCLLVVSRDTERGQLRAYVGTIPGDVEKFGDAENQRFTLTVKNFGDTPAYDVGSLISYNGVYKNISVASRNATIKWCPCERSEAISVRRRPSNSTQTRDRITPPGSGRHRR
jgi:hypothetical protein